MSEVDDRVAAALTKFDGAASIAHDVANGPAGATVESESGPIPTLLEWQARNEAALGNLPELQARVAEVEAQADALDTEVGVLQGQVEALGQSVAYVTTYAGLRAYTGAATIAHTTGRDNIFDGAGGFWVVLPGDSTTPDNDFVTLVDVTGRRWARQWTGALNLTWAGAKLNRTVDDTAAWQKVMDYCSQFTYWPEVKVTGPSWVNGNLFVGTGRTVDLSHSEWLVRGEGPGAGIWVNRSFGNIFELTSTVPVDPQGEFITFQNMHFESSSIFNNTWIMSGKFLRTKNQNCNFRLIRYMSSTLYAQSHHFVGCNLRNNPAAFIDCAGSYDIRWIHGIIENANTFIRSLDAARGTNGLRISDSVIEGMQTSTVVATGLSGFDYSGNHVESNVANDLNLWGGTVRNRSVNISGNYVFNPLGAMAYHGPTDNVSSQGNSVSGLLHGNVAQVTQWTDVGSTCGTLADIAAATTVGGLSTNGTITGPIRFGTGAPANGLGKVGDAYIRSDTPGVANQRIYFKTAAAVWTPII